MTKIVLCYVPVIQKGYIEFFTSLGDVDEIFIWGNGLIETEASLKKEIRALSPNQARKALRAILLRDDIMIARLETLQYIAKTANPLMVPDDAISRSLVENVLVPLGLKSFKFHPVFLRWDKKNATTPTEITIDRTVSAESLGEQLKKASQEANLSSDWWRRVGAVLFDSKGIVSVVHNSHLPTEYTPYIDGDPRGSFFKGVHIELTTAIHAESLAIANAARFGRKTKGLSLLVTTFPCPICAKLIAASGISKVIFCEGYAMLDGETVLRNAGVEIVQVK